MGKLVILKLGKGSFEQGFPVTLQIGEEKAPPSIEITGELPSEPGIPEAYARWQGLYRRLDLPGRPMGLPKVPQPKASAEACHQAAQELRDRLNQWLDARSFRPIREKWLEQLKPSDIIRAIIQTNDPQLRRLPWHLWDLIERYPQAEIALSPQDFGSPPHRQEISHATVRILAILGNSQGIDIQTDRAILEGLTNASVTFLVEPQRQDLSDQLWEQPWEILFFAGHSVTQGADQAGLIHLNQTESLTIGQLKHALEKAVERGLKLAIFNSCDGLGLARELAYLQIPQLIVMREPVPDRVAQEFLKYFLAAYAQDEPLYLAVRDARKRLQALENQFPCATWLPVICQHPAEIPPTWQELHQETPTLPSPMPLPATLVEPKLKPKVQSKLSAVLLVSLLITGLVVGIRYFGLLQPLELRAFDQLLQMRPKESPDTRILVVEVTEKDVSDQNQADLKKPRDRSLSDRALDQLLEKLEPLQPVAIGLDLYRDYPAQLPRLAAKLRQSDRLIAVCKTGDPNSNHLQVTHPPEITSEQALARLGFSDVITDDDHIVRRHLLGMDSSPSCPAAYALSVQLALRYLAKQGIPFQFTLNGNWQFGKTLIKPIQFPTGGYFNLDGRGSQILLNYRSPENASSFATLQDVVPRISLGEVLAGKLSPEMVKDRIVLIGTTAPSFKDYFPVPFATEAGHDLGNESGNHSGAVQEIAGVILHAQMISQILSHVLDGRPLLWTLPLWAEVLWISGWALLGGLLSLYSHRWVVLSVASGLAIASLYGLCFGLLIQVGCWLPLLPPVLAQVGTTTTSLLSAMILQRRRQGFSLPF